MKWSTPLCTVSIGTRATEDQAVPLVEVTITMSLALQPRMNRQSCQARYTVPAASTSAVGFGAVRRLPATLWSVTLAIGVVLLQLAPPLLEVKARMAVSLALANGTTTLPSG